jgi:hypothetical protein
LQHSRGDENAVDASWNFVHPKLDIPTCLDHLLIFDACGAAAAFPTQGALRRAKTSGDSQNPWPRVANASIDGMMSCGTRQSCAGGPYGFTNMVSKGLASFFSKDAYGTRRFRPFTVDGLWKAMGALPEWNLCNPLPNREFIQFQKRDGTRMLIQPIL